MNHDEIMSALDEFHDGELNPSARAEVEFHLRSCQDCREALEARQRAAEFLLSSAAAAYEGFDVERFSRGVMSRISGEESRARLPTWRALLSWRGWLVPAASFAAAAVAMWFLGGFADRGSLAADMLAEQRGGVVMMDWLDEPTATSVGDLESSALALR